MAGGTGDRIKNDEVGKKTYQELQRHIHVLILQTDMVRSL